MEQMLGGFFETWSQLMMNAPLPGTDDDFKMEEASDGYRFTAEHEKTHAVILVKRDLVIDAIEAKTPEFQGVVHPHFSRQEGGLILTSYEADYTAGGPSQRLSVKVEYQNVDGLTLPHTITLSMPLPQGQLNWPMTLEGCHVKKKRLSFGKY